MKYMKSAVEFVYIICTYVCTCMYACMYVCIYVYMYVCMYVCMYECMYVHIEYSNVIKIHNGMMLVLLYSKSQKNI